MSTSASSFLPLLVVGVGIAATQSRWRNEHWKLWISHKIVKLRWMRHAPQLTAMAVATDSYRCFSKRWHIADVKNITGDDQATVMVDENSVNIAYTFNFTSVYVCEIATVSLRLTAMAVATDSRRRFRKDDTLPTSKTSTAMTRIDQNSIFTKIYTCKIKQDLSKNIFFCC